ncbi:MAG: ATP-binding protein [Actinomycetes bacterium]
MRTAGPQGATLVDDPGRPEDAGSNRAPGLIDVLLPGVPSSIAAARHAVADLLNGPHRVPDVVVDDVLLLVSELVTNAVLHAGTHTRVTASVRPGRVVVAVGDGDPHHAPAVAARGSEATNGRGLMLVDALATDWGIDLRKRWKVVWFETSYDASGVVEREPVESLGNGQPAARGPRIRRQERSA